MMLMLDIPFQVSQEDLQRCLESNLELIENIVIDVDEPTWLKWQDRRQSRYMQQNAISDDQMGMAVADDDDDISFIKEENIGHDQYSAESLPYNSNQNAFPYGSTSGQMIRSPYKQFQHRKRRRQPSASATKNSTASQKRRNQNLSRQAKYNPQQAPYALPHDPAGSWSATEAGVRVPPLHGGDTSGQGTFQTEQTAVKPEPSSSDGLGGADDYGNYDADARQSYGENPGDDFAEGGGRNYTADTSGMNDDGLYLKREDTDGQLEQRQMDPHAEDATNDDSFFAVDDSMNSSDAQSGSGSLWQQKNKERALGGPDQATDHSGGTRAPPDVDISAMKMCKFCYLMIAPDEFKNHEAMHKSVFTCPVCNKSMTTNKGLEIHMRCHNGEKPFQCKFCSAQFSDLSNCKRHIRNQHSADSEIIKAGFTILKL
ncbi:uncharacterized protein LOC141908711 isoform X1 [Tubulanus polymorphus]|uniref:uncharacterized protein LOC141908711 isoform X1 n=1 Tax=Tubulanus polymorphus TaxID=672921 RepID=UPI003DA261C2